MPRLSLSLLAVLTAVVALPASAGADTRWSIRGAGWGHGVGMSQYGARGMAESGHDHRSILRHFYRGTALGHAPDRLVRVLLREQISRVSVTDASRACGRRLRSSSTYRLTPARSGVVLRSARGRLLVRCGARARVAGGPSVRWLRRDEYRGAFEVRPAGGRLRLVNAVRLEDYLRGVVPNEMPAAWHPAALRAQAVAARSYAVTSDAGGAGFDQYADVRSQVYRGTSSETPSTDAAIRATRGEIVTYAGRPVMTPFHSTSGGRTENVELVWGGDPKPWLRSVEDPGDVLSPRHRWGPLRLSGGGMERRLGFPGLREIDVLQRGRSPRIVRAALVGHRSRRTVSGALLRARLGLNDTWASFARVSTRADGHTLRGDVAPAGRVALQRRERGAWETVRSVRVGESGRYAVRAGPGRWRVLLDGWAAGPTVRLDG